MPRFFEKTLLILVMIFTAFAVGCETTDYEPLIMKKKLKEMQAEIDALREEVSELKESGVSKSGKSDAGAAGVVSTTGAKEFSVEDETESREALEKSDVYFTQDESGLVVEADLAECRKLEDSLAKLTDFPVLKKIVLDGTKANSATFEALGKVASLEHLEIQRCNPSPEDLAQLKQLKGLKFLQLFKATLSEEAMKELGEFPALEQIRCAQTRVGDAELKQLENLKTLKAIDLSDCNRVTIKGLKSLVKCPKLAFLKVWGQSIDNDCMAEVAKMKSLRVLGISDTRVDDDGIAKLAGLDLSEVHMTRTRVGDGGIKVLSGMKNINSLNLRDTGLTDAAIGYISGLGKLKKLDLSECTSPGITNACATEIAKMDNLASLNLWSTDFSDEGVKSLTGLKKLTWLNLDNTKITDDGVAMLKELPQLTWLHLGKTKITDRETKVLIGLENLKYLNISYTGVSQDAYYDILDSLGEMGCEIIAP